MTSGPNLFDIPYFGTLFFVAILMTLTFLIAVLFDRMKFHRFQFSDAFAIAKAIIIGAPLIYVFYAEAFSLDYSFWETLTTMITGLLGIGIVEVLYTGGVKIKRRLKEVVK